MSSDIKNLKIRTIKGLFWSFSEQFGRHGINTVITFILARLLTPQDYGLIGLTSVFFAIATAIVEGGFRQALIRKSNLSQTDRSTVFFTNLFIAVILYMILFFCSPIIASLLKEPRLIQLVRFISIQIIIYAFQIVQIVDLTRQMDFKTQVKITLPSGIISGIVAIILAWKGFGVWSLAIQMVFSGFLTSISYWIHNRWRPTIEFSLNSLKEIFSFSSKVLASSLLSTIFNNLYTFIIGAFFSTQQLGYYTFSSKIKLISAEQITTALQRVSYPALASLQNDTEKLRIGYRKITQCAVHIIFPLMVSIAFMAEPVFTLLFNDKWLPAVPYLQILCIVGATFPLNAINLNVLCVKGRSDLFLKLEIIKKLLISAMLIITIPLGIYYLLLGQALLSIVAYFLNSHYTAELIGYSVIKQLSDISASFITSALMGVALHLISQILLGSAFFKTSVLTFIAITTYVSISEIMKIEAYFTIRDLLFKGLLNLKKKTSPTIIEQSEIVPSKNGIIE